MQRQRNHDTRQPRATATTSNGNHNTSNGNGNDGNHDTLHEQRQPIPATTRYTLHATRATVYICQLHTWQPRHATRYTSNGNRCRMCTYHDDLHDVVCQLQPWQPQRATIYTTLCVSCIHDDGNATATRATVAVSANTTIRTCLYCILRTKIPTCY